MGAVVGLSFADLRHVREPGWFAEQDERERRATVLGDFITKDRHRCFGIAEPGKRDGEEYDLPVIESVRTLRRLSPDDELDFHIVAEVTQRVRRNKRWFFGGSTSIRFSGAQSPMPKVWLTIRVPGRRSRNSFGRSF